MAGLNKCLAEFCTIYLSIICCHLKVIEGTNKSLQKSESPSRVWKLPPPLFLPLLFQCECKLKMTIYIQWGIILHWADLQPCISFWRRKQYFVQLLLCVAQQSALMLIHNDIPHSNIAPHPSPINIHARSTGPHCTTHQSILYPYNGMDSRSNIALSLREFPYL